MRTFEKPHLLSGIYDVLKCSEFVLNGEPDYCLSILCHDSDTLTSIHGDVCLSKYHNNYSRMTSAEAVRLFFCMMPHYIYDVKVLFYNCFLFVMCYNST